MKWLVVLVAVVGASVAFVTWGSSGPDLTCPGPATSGFRDGSYGMRTPEDALGSLLDDADRVTHERDDATGFETVTYRGYDADGELRSVVVVEGGNRGWIASRVDTCE